MEGQAHAASVKLLTMIPVPGEPIESYDIGTVDEKTHLYYQTDRSNKSIDIFDVIKNKFVGRVGGFVGVTPGGIPTSGGNGISLVNNGTEVWSGDGDSTVKVIDLKGKITSILTGGKSAPMKPTSIRRPGLPGRQRRHGRRGAPFVADLDPARAQDPRQDPDRAGQVIDAPRYNQRTGCSMCRCR
jgi:hypothetical protein